MGVHVYVVRVFTDADGNGGNPLGIVEAESAECPAPPDRQAIATRLGFSETVFVTPSTPIARLQIFTPATELPFAGHPTVGTAWWLRTGGTAVQALDVPAGRVEVGEFDGLTTVRARAEWAPEFVFHDLDSPADVDALDPDGFSAGHHYAWAWLGDDAIRSRMFAPDMGIAEDEATGAAAVRITARLQRDLRITQGRGSTLVTAWDPEGWVRLGGRVVADVPIDL